MSNDFILRTVSGELTRDRFMQIFDEITFSYSIFQHKNIICDFSEARFSDGSMSELLDIAIRMAVYRNVLKGKIAHVARGNGAQIQIGRSLATVMSIKGFNYNFFCDMEEAKRWVVG